jgi:signal peptidase I
MVDAAHSGRYNQFVYLWRKRSLHIALSVAAVLAVLPSYVWLYKLSGGSAAPTILRGDRFIVNRAAYDIRVPYSRIVLFHSGSPHRGDLVQAHLPCRPGIDVKRVLGLPGETIEVRENRVIVNRHPLPVQPLDSIDFSWVPPAYQIGSTVVMEDGHWAAYTPGKGQYRNTPAVQLGPGEYFVMGDNRDNSFDSRAFGPLPRKQIFSKVITVIPNRNKH